MKEVDIYTDGACKGNPGPGGWGALLRARSGHEKEIYGGELETTNNRMELTAVIRAIESLKSPCAVALYLDSEYVRKGITEWIHGWKARGWRNAAKQPVKNADLWQRLDELVHGGEHEGDAQAGRPRQAAADRETNAVAAAAIGDGGIQNVVVADTGIGVGGRGVIGGVVGGLRDDDGVLRSFEDAVGRGGRLELGLEGGQRPLQDPGHRSLIGSGVEDDHAFVRPHRRLTSSGSGALRPSPAVGQVGDSAVGRTQAAGTTENSSRPPGRRPADSAQQVVGRCRTAGGMP